MTERGIKLGVATLVYTIFGGSPKGTLWVLLGRRRTGHATAHWVTPGGGVEFGESVPDAALRELHEETGLTGEFRGVTNMVGEIITPETHKVILYTAVEITDGKHSYYDKTEELYALRWVRVSELADLRAETSRITREMLDHMVPKIEARHADQLYPKA